MPTNTSLSTQQASISCHAHPAIQNLKRTARAIKARTGTRFTAIAAMSFALTLPALGIIDPKVLVAASRPDVHAIQSLLARGEAALRHMDVLELFATGGVAVAVFGVIALAGYVRANCMTHSANRD
jgi:hypothetical protein